jgi:hypothetical protein
MDVFKSYINIMMAKQFKLKLLRTAQMLAKGYHIIYIATKRNLQMKRYTQRKFQKEGIKFRTDASTIILT